MPPKINTNGAPPAQSQQHYQPSPPAPQRQQPPVQHRSPTQYDGGGASERDDEGVRYEEGDNKDARGPSMSYPRYDSFTTPWPADRHTYACSVQKIVKWPFGTMVTFRVEVGPERGRTFDWGQSQPAALTGDKAKNWRSNLFGAYAAGGWPLDPNPDAGWPGWEKNSAGVAVPPYDVMFVHTAPDGVQVPVVLEVDTWTGTQSSSGKDPTPFVNAVSHWLPDGAAMPIQAPMPYHVPEWLARKHRWSYTPDGIATGKYGKIAVVKVDYKQVPFNHGGLRTLRDVMRGDR